VNTNSSNHGKQHLTIVPASCWFQVGVPVQDHTEHALMKKGTAPWAVTPRVETGNKHLAHSKSVTVPQWPVVLPHWNLNMLALVCTVVSGRFFPAFLVWIPLVGLRCSFPPVLK
jgi:hypothetical protein